MNDLQVRLARACAHGTRQMGFVNELLVDNGFADVDDSLGYVYYGKSKLGSESWRSLKKRLVANGFIITNGPWTNERPHPMFRGKSFSVGRRKIEMTFSV